MARLLALTVLLLVALTPTAHAAKRDRAVPAKWAKANKLTKKSARKDLDRDGLGTWAEWRSKTNPRKADSDGDERPDGREDRDRDGLANAFELAARTDPGRADSDGDRRRDGREDADRDGLDHAAEAKWGYAPRKRDSDGDGTRDGDENAGTVTALAGPLVTVALARGGAPLVALLGEDTELACSSLAEDEAPGTDDEDEDEEEIDGDEELEDDGSEAGDDESDGDDPTDAVDELDDALAEAARLEEDEAAEDDGCASVLRPGTLVRSAATTGTAPRLVLTELELLLPTG